MSISFEGVWTFGFVTGFLVAFAFCVGIYFITKVEVQRFDDDEE